MSATMKTTARNLTRGQSIRINPAWQTAHFATVVAANTIGGRMAVAVRSTRTAMELQLPIADAIEILDLDMDQEVILQDS